MVRCFDSITNVPAALAGATVIAASHGGAYVAKLALQLGLGGLIVSDAGIGRERAGIAAVDILDARGIPCAAVSVRSARIGDGTDCFDRGVISFANQAATRLGVQAGLKASAAFALMQKDARRPMAEALPLEETRRTMTGIALADSNSLVRPQDRDAVFVTGSHGALLGGRPESALKSPVRAAIYNDADGGIDGAGYSRLPALDARGIAAATVSAWSARIGDAQSTFDDGWVTCVNEHARKAGGEIGLSCRELVARLVAHPIGGAHA
jgi:hypothetical protein